MTLKVLATEPKHTNGNIANLYRIQSAEWKDDPWYWENICKYDKELISRIYKECLSNSAVNQSIMSLKSRRKTEIDIFQKWNTNGQLAYKKILNINH